MHTKILGFSFALLLFLSCVQAEITTLDNAVTRAYTKKITSTLSTSDFKPNQALRRDEAAKFFVTFAKLIGKTEEVVDASQCTFTDLNKTRTDLSSIVIESCKLGIFKGSKGKFIPDGMLTNAQAVAVLMRIVDGYQKESGKSWRDNYYTRANELQLLGSGTMNEANDVAKRGDVITLIYNARKMTGVNEKPPIDTSVFNIQLVEKTTGDMLYPYALSYSGGFIWFALKSWNTLAFTFTTDNATHQASESFLWYNENNTSLIEMNDTTVKNTIKTLTCNDTIMAYNPDTERYDTIAGNRETITTRADNCIAQAFQALYNLINEKEKNTYVTQKLEEFKQTIDNGSIYTGSFIS